ncbi:MAG: ABC transporter ATP-binding protein [Pirellulales bacterium]
MTPVPAPTDSPALRLHAVSKRFGQELALDDVSFEAPRGSVFALLGANGAGKTTAIRILLGLAAPDAGRAEVLGLDSATQSLEIRRRVGCVAERPTLYEWMSVDEIGWFAAGFHDPQFLPRYRELAAQYGLPANRKIKELSKGMRAKAALALALGNDPELLILDEPTSGLDPLVRREFLESMVDRAAAGKTVFLSSHQLSEVERVADYIAILRQGRLVLVDRLEQLKCDICEVTITLAPDAVQPPELPGEILRQRRRARQWQLLARSSSLDAANRLLESIDVADVAVRTPSLEEIFTGYMQSPEQTAT